MPRPPRPKPTKTAPPNGGTPSNPAFPWRTSWVRGASDGHPHVPLQPWFCELCRTCELVPVPVSRRALDAVLFEHRVHCRPYDQTDSGEAQEDDQGQRERSRN